MSDFSRRTFLKMMGQGTAVLGMGISAGNAFAEIPTEKAATKADTKGKYQLFYPGEYHEWEKEAVEERLAAAEKGPEKNEQISADDPVFAGRSVQADVVNGADLLKYNQTWDPYNPLFNDEAYAKKAGYPGIPAFPGFKSPRAGGAMRLTIPMDFADLWYYANDGGDNRTYQHIFAGDSFTSEGESVLFKDLTVPGSDLRHFNMGGTAIMYNEKGEPAGRSKSSLRNAYRKIIDGSTKASFSDNMAEWVHYFPEAHYTTDEEYEYIKELWDNETIRGSQKLYWEDVNIGDEPTPTCSGPISYSDMVGWHGGGGRGITLRARRDQWSTMYRDQYGIYLPDTALHYGGRNIPGSRMVMFNHTAAMHIIRMVTNYIGDAGLVTRFAWFFRQFFKEMQYEPLMGGKYLDKVPYMKGKQCTVHGSEGDTVIARGYVTDKYKNKKGEGIIDISCWGETLDNRIIQIVAASVKLPLKKA